MKSKILSFVLIAAFLLSLTLVSAAVSFTAAPASLTLTPLANSTTFTITALQNGTISLPSTVSLGNVTYSLSPTNIVLNTSAPAKTITLATLVAPATIGTYTGSLLISNAANSSDNQTIAVTYSKGLCSASNSGQLLVDSMEINVKDGFGEDDDFLYPLDEVEVSFNIENSGAWDIKDIEITACLFDKTKGKCIMDEEDMDITNDNMDLDSGDDDDVTLAFTVDPDSLKVGNEDYTLYVSANGEIDDSEAGSYDNTQSCSSGSEDIKIRTTDTFAVISDISYTDNLSCGDVLEVSANIWNVGDEDFADDEIYFELYSKELGIDKEISFDSGIGSMEKQTVSYSMVLPANLSEKTYKLQLSVLDEDHAVMQNKEDDKSQTALSVAVSKCAASQASKSVAISADFSSKTPKAVIGSQFVIESVITNTGASAASFTVGVSGNSAWSEVTVDPKTSFTLEPGKSQQVDLYFDVSSEAEEGDNTFKISVLSSDGSVAKESQVQVTLEKGLTADRIMNHIKDNWYIYAIVLVNLILIIAIIVIVSKMASSRKEDD